jgi:hypothetical protein
MFQEAIAQAGLPVRGITGIEAFSARFVPALARSFPALFFVHVLGGEGPIDHAQRMELARGGAVHPLLRRIMQIHVTEEARHIAFAESWLREHVPRLSSIELLRLRVMTPWTLAAMAKQMLVPPKWLLDLYGVPKHVRREAWRHDEASRREIVDGLRAIRALCIDVGIVTPAWSRLWQTLGIWDAPAPQLVARS